MPGKLSLICACIATVVLVAVARGGGKPSATTEPLYGADLIVGPRGSALALTIGTLYGKDYLATSVPYSLYGRLLAGDLSRQVKVAVPMAFGDSLDGQYRIVATLPKYFGVDDQGRNLPPEQVLDYRPGLKLQFAQGNCFANNKFEAVVGSEVARLTGKSLGDAIQATHTIATPGHAADVHPQKWKIVGVLAPTNTPIDRTVYIPLLSFYAISEHATELIARKILRDGGSITEAELAPDDGKTPGPISADGIQHFKDYDYDTRHDTFKVTLPPENWAVSAILVRTTDGTAPERVTWALAGSSECAMAVDPESTLDTFPTLFQPWVAFGAIPAEEPKANRSGVAIAAITTDSLASAAGLKAGDVIVRVGDTHLNNWLDLSDVLAKARPGEKVQMKVRRHGDLVTLELTLPGPDGP